MLNFAAFEEDISKSPALLTQFVGEHFDIDSLCENAAKSGYQISSEEFGKMVRKKFTSIEPISNIMFRIYDEQLGDSRELTEDEIKWVGGSGTSTSVDSNVSVESEAAVAVVVLVAAAAVVLAIAFVFSANSAS